MYIHSHVRFLTTVANMWRGRKEKISHKHFSYSCLFNNVELEEKMVNCVLEDQRLVYSDQEKKKKETLPDKYKYLMYFEKDFCAYCTITKDIKTLAMQRRQGLLRSVTIQN